MIVPKLLQQIADRYQLKICEGGPSIRGSCGYIRPSSGPYLEFLANGYWSYIGPNTPEEEIQDVIELIEPFKRVSSPSGPSIPQILYAPRPQPTDSLEQIEAKLAELNQEAKTLDIYSRRRNRRHKARARMSEIEWRQCQLTHQWERLVGA
jgi:hypothetical protein